ncbi:hypothetical protein BKA81DRAFT_423503 [Phyllosticta paracitricarpa]
MVYVPPLAPAPTVKWTSIALRLARFCLAVGLPVCIRIGSGSGSSRSLTIDSCAFLRLSTDVDYGCFGQTGDGEHGVFAGFSGRRTGFACVGEDWMSGALGWAGLGWAGLS